jgi:hypothetical protein
MAVAPPYRGGLLDVDSVELSLEGYSIDEDSAGPSGRSCVLRPHDPARSCKVVEPGVARLLQAAAQGGPVPVAPAEGWVRSDVAAVVLDGMASLRSGSTAVRGVDAVHGLFPALTEPAAEPGVLHRLSDRALAAGARYVGERGLAGFLYAYGRLPVGDAELAALPDRAAVSRWLGIEPVPDWLRPWRQQDLRSAGWWNLWHLRDAPQTIARDQPGPKLYVSTQLGDLPDAFRELCLAAAEVGIPTVKVGSDAHAVYRPDKLVAYAVDMAQLDALAARLLPRLSGAIAHGVPFTAERSVDGMLSWGVDPAPTDAGVARESWRESCAAVAADGLRRAAGRGVRTATAMAKAWLWVNDIDPWTWSPVSP